MKTLLKTLCASALTAALLATVTPESYASDMCRTLKAEPALSFNKIVISGNVTVVISQKSKESIIVDGDFNRSALSVTRKGYTLTICSTSAESVTVNVSVKDLQRIDASGNASVRTAGKLNVQYLQVFLRDAAKADVDASTESLYSLTSGNTNLRLSGSTKDYTVVKDAVSKLTLQDFIAARSTVDSISTEMLAALKMK